MRVILIGFMGSGKSSLGKSLAKELEMPFFDLDDVIVEEEGNNIPTIFAKHGETYFRTVESKYLKEYIHQYPNLILATGGGTACFNDNMKYLKDAGFTIYLNASPEILHYRLSKSKHIRPLIKGLYGDKLLAFITSKLSEREAFYKTADKEVFISNDRAENLKNVQALISEFQATELE